jgi:hypothetical protein
VDLVQEYIREWNGMVLHGGKIFKCANAYDINNGLCDNFAEDLMDKLGGENNEQFILSNDMFLCDFYEDAIGLWGKKDLIRTKNGSAWSKKMLSLYSPPSVNCIESFEYLPSHVWVCINSMHYDAESPKGVKTPWELMIFRKWITKYNKDSKFVQQKTTSFHLKN